MQYADFAAYAIACAIVCSHIIGIPITVQVYSVHCWPRKYTMSRFYSADTLRPYRKGVPNSWSGNSEAARTEACADTGNKQQFRVRRAQGTIWSAVCNETDSAHYSHLSNNEKSAHTLQIRHVHQCLFIGIFIVVTVLVSWQKLCEF